MTKYRLEQLRLYMISKLNVLEDQYYRGKLISHHKTKRIKQLYLQHYKSNPLEDFNTDLKLGNLLKVINNNYVYFIGNIEYKIVKIGFSSNPQNRLKSLQTGCPYKLKILKKIEGNSHLEKDYHKIFKDFNMEGEWFELRGELLDFVNKTQNITKKPILKEGEWIKVTPQIIEATRNSNNAFTKNSVKALGLKFPLKKGWKNRLIGKMINKETYYKNLTLIK